MGSSECRTLEKNLKDLMHSIGYKYPIVMSDDIDLFIQYGINKTPALLINKVLIHNAQLQDLDYVKQTILENIDSDDNYHKAS